MKDLVKISRQTIAVLLLMAMGCTTCMAQSIESKAVQKECKRVCKQLQKEGWKVFDAISTNLNTAIQGYYAALEAGGDSVQPLSATGIASNVNVAKTKAKTHAAHDYASQLRSEVESITSVKIQNTQSGNDTSSQKEMENSLTVKVEQLVKGMTPMVTLRREHDGQTEVQMLYIVRHISMVDQDE